MRLIRLVPLLFVLATSVAHAQYPTKPLRLVVPFPPGGATDLVSRALAQRFAEGLGQPVVIDNKPGAGGAIGSDFVAKAAADGYTLLMATTSTHSIGPALNPKTPFNAERDFAPIGHVGSSPNILVVGPNVAARSLAELIALAKAKPGSLTYASSGVGTIIHLSGELLRTMAGIDIVHVPYKGTALALPDLLSGQVTMVFDNLVSALPNLRAGKVRALALTVDKRSPLLPDVPTMTEAGLPGYQSDAYFGLFAPAGTPRAVLVRLNTELNRVLKLPDIVEGLARQGIEPVGGSPEQFARVVAADTAKWTKVIRDAQVRIE